MMRLKSRNPQANGFSLVEMLVVVAIVLVIAAVAVPQVLTGMRSLRLRNSATNISGIIQQTRQRSVRDNRNYAMLSGRINNQNIVFVDLNNNGVYNTNPAEPMVLIDSDVGINNAAPNQVALRNLVSPGAAMDFRATNFVAPAVQTDPPAFNARGWPCVPTAGTIGTGGVFGIPACPTAAPGAGNPPPVGYVYFLRSTSMQIDGWAAVTVSPGGRIRTWRCQTSVANNCNWF